MIDRIRALLDQVRSTPPWLRDLVLAVAVSEADLVAVLFTDRSPGPLGSVATPVAVIAVLLIALPLVFRRHNPNLTITLTGFGAGIAGAFGIPVQPLAPLVALYTVAAYTSLADTVIATSIFLAITTGLVLSQGGVALLYSNTLIVVGVAVIGRIVQAYRQQTVEMAARAAELERSREERALLAVRAERSRIAREMHDVLAHSTSVMVVQATGARRLLPGRPEKVAEALAVIEDTGRQSLGELRRMLGLLREAGEDSPTRPQPGLDDLQGLVEEFKLSGLPVAYRIVGELPAVDTAVALSAYRIAQEALTNALKHAEATRVTVELRIREDRLELEILDDGGRTPLVTAAAGRCAVQPGRGYGVVGMRERAALVGGHLEAGPRPGGGYRVAAVLPFDDRDARLQGVAS